MHYALGAAAPLSFWGSKRPENDPVDRFQRGRQGDALIQRRAVEGAIADLSHAVGDVYFMKVDAVPEGAFIDDVCFFMGEIYINRGEFNNADIALTAAVHHYPKSAMWWSRLGYAREQAGYYEGALAAYDQALKINKNYADAKAGRDRVAAKL